MCGFRGEEQRGRLDRLLVELGLGAAAPPPAVPDRRQMSVGRRLGVDEPVERPQALIDHRLRFEDPAGDDQRAREQGVLVGHQCVRPGPIGRRVANGTARAGGWREASTSLPAGRPTLSRRPPRSPGPRTPRRAARRARGLPAAPGRTERPRRRPARHRGRSRSCRPARAWPGRSCRRSPGRRSTSRRSSGSSGTGRSARRRRRRGSGIRARRSPRPPPSPARCRGAGRPGAPGRRRRRSSRGPGPAATRSRAA